MRNRLLSYLHAIGATLPDSVSARRAISLSRALLCMPFLLFPLSGSRRSRNWLVGGPAYRLIDRAEVDDRNVTLCDVSSIPKRWLLRRPFINLALLYVATTLYCFVSRRFARLFRHVARMYRRTVVESGVPDVVVWHSDALPLVRAFRYVLRGMTTQTVCIQHGYFHSPLPGEIDGSHSDLIALYHPTQARYFTDSGVDAEKLVFAPELLTFAVPPVSPRPTSARRVVWLVGEGWWSHDRRIDDLVFAMYSQIKNSFVRAGWQVRYRPHPSERRWLTRYLMLDPSLAFRTRRPISKGDVYIGMTSSFIVFCAGAGAKACFVDTGGQIPNGLADANIPFISVEGLVDFATLKCLESRADVFGDRFRLDRLFDLQVLNGYRVGHLQERGS